ncbi:MAG: ABC transporter ATP-binding protein [Sterolibacterium sp.]|nr:ABC transporter ATP-binding protein [Sterolibacterium sp.]
MSAKGLFVTLRQAAPIPLDCSLQCAPGELTALVGPSGSGKSTVLRCIAGLHRPQQGHVACAGAAWLDTEKDLVLPPQQRRVGMMFQNYSLLPHLTAAGNVALGLEHLPAQKRSEKAREWLARVHLHGLEQRRPEQLSGGQQQRVALARALAREPQVLLLDEPFSAVDQVTRRKLQQELARLRRELEIPIVLVTHDLDEARILADRMVLLHRGTSLQSGRPEEVMTRPANAAIAHLVGLNNLFAGRIVAHNAEGMTILESLGLRLEVARDHGFTPGDKVSWVIPPEGILLHRRDHPSRGETENPVTGRVVDCIALGPYTQIVLRPDGGELPLTFSVPTHAAQRNQIAAGATARVTLLAQAIHLMPQGEPQ